MQPNYSNGQMNSRIPHAIPLNGNENDQDIPAIQTVQIGEFNDRNNIEPYNPIQQRVAPYNPQLNQGNVVQQQGYDNENHFNDIKF